LAFSARYAPRRGQIPYWLVAASILAAVVAVLPVVVAVLGGVPGDASPRSAFATAPAGDYAVVAAPGETEDAIVMVSLSDPSSRTELARVSHLPGYSPVGAVSPDSRRLALTVVDAGSPARPGASLLIVDLESGAVTRRAVAVDPLQPPVWLPDSSAVVVTRTVSSGSPAVDVSLVAVPAAGGDERVLEAHERVLGAYPVAVDGSGRLLSVVIDGTGSTLFRGGSELLRLSDQVTRDWRLSPDGTELAYIESSVRDGLHYLQKVAQLDGPAAALAQQAQQGQQLGVAWNPGTGVPTFGQEPGEPGTGALAQSAGGFDVPLAYSADGRALAVQAWSGNSFGEAGRMTLTLVDGLERRPLPNVSRFFGWVTR